MKRIFLLSLLLGAFVASCDQYEYDDSAIKESLSELEGRVTALETLKQDLTALKNIVEGLVTVISCEEKNGAYTLVLSDGTTVYVPAEYIPEESAPETSVEPTFPVVTIVEVAGVKCWGYYADGKIQTLTYNGKPVEIGGEEAFTPQLRVDSDEYLSISVDGGKTWTKTEAKISNSLFSSLQKEDDHVVLTLADGYTEVMVPIYKERQIQFIAFSGKTYFAAGETKSITVGMVGIESFTVTEKPEGWKTVLSEGQLQVTAPAEGLYLNSVTY